MTSEAGHRHINPWIIAASVMIATFMEVLDTTVVNVSLPHIAGNLSSTTEEATWVLTSYLVSNAIVLPITGWLGTMFGRCELLSACIAIFTLASFMCGAAPNLELLIAARILQGAGGGALQPISQAILLESFPPEKRGLAMAVFGMGIVVAPIIGPTLGGWITDNYSWRWIFYINLPIGVAALIMVRNFIFNPPYARRRRAPAVDLIGLALLAIWVAALQIMLDKGQQEDWFASNLIRSLAVVSFVGLIAFLIRELTTDHPIVDLTVFENGNFAVGTSLMTLMGVVLYGSITLLPLFLQTVLNYPALQSGLTVSPRGFGSIIGMVLVGRLVGKLDTRFMIAFGFLLVGISTWQFGEVNLEISSWVITMPNILNGFGTAFVFVPLTTVTMGTLANQQMGNATGIFNLMRNVGGGIGIALMTSMLSRTAQSQQMIMATHTSELNPIFQQQRHMIEAALTPHLGPVAAAQAAPGLMYRSLQQQANLLSFVSDFRLLALLCFLSVPSVLLLRKVKKSSGPTLAH